MQKSHVRLNRIVVMLALLTPAASLYAGEVSQSRQHELLYLLKQDCGSCHGLTLKGGLGPALTPQALQGKPKAAMVATILNGREGTPMPPWSSELSESDARWLVDMLYRGVE